VNSRGNKVPAINQPKVGPPQEVYRDKAQSISRVVADFGEFEKEFFVRDAGLRAGVLLVKDDSVLLVRQYRLQINALSWEIPGGRVEDNESPEQAAIRECYEETGIRCQALQQLLFYHPGMDVTHNPTSLYWTSDFEDADEYQAKPDEVVTREWVSLKRCDEMLASGEMVDAFTLLAILTYQHQSGAR
jgi:8-oxo-dGTP pyrophosphatase MutT (NUDIX family)